MLISIAERLNNLEFGIENQVTQNKTAREQVEETIRNLETDYNAREEEASDVEECERHDRHPPPRQPRVRPPPQPLVVDLVRGISNDWMGDITKKVRVEAPEFAGKIDPQAFSDWLTAMDDYFDWDDMTDDRKV